MMTRTREVIRYVSDKIKKRMDFGHKNVYSTNFLTLVAHCFRVKSEDLLRKGIYDFSLRTSHVSPSPKVLMMTLTLTMASGGVGL